MDDFKNGKRTELRMKRYIPSYGFFALAMCVSTSSFSGDDVDLKKSGIRSSYGACLDGSNGITSSMLDCNGKEQSYQDKRLNATYRSLLAELPEDKRQKLRQEERGWIRERDGTCVEPKDAGTAGDVDYSNCFLNETAKQATKLQDMLKADKS